MIEAYKMLTGKYDTSFPSFLSLASHKHDPRGHQLKLQQNTSKWNLRKNFLINHVASMWNDLPENVLQAKTVKDFEEQLDLY